MTRGEKTAGCLPLARSAAAQAAFPPAMRGQFRNAFQGDTPAAPRRCSHLAGPLRQRLTALPTSPQRGGRMGGADDIGGHAHARDSFAALRSAQNAKGESGPCGCSPRAEKFPSALQGEPPPAAAPLTAACASAAFSLCGTRRALCRRGGRCARLPRGRGRLLRGGTGRQVGHGQRTPRRARSRSGR